MNTIINIVIPLTIMIYLNFCIYRTMRRFINGGATFRYVVQMMTFSSVCLSS